MATIAAQPHILAAPQSLSRSLTLRLLPQTDPRPALRQLRDSWIPSWGVVGMGEQLIRALGSSVSGLRTFPALSDQACTVPSTQQSVWLRFDGDDRSTLFDRSEKALAMLVPAFAIDDVLDAFLYAGGRDLTGYEDGTENPKAEAAVESAHVKRTAQESFDPPAFMLRRSLAWASGREQGLEFIAYVESLDRFERPLR